MAYEYGKRPLWQWVLIYVVIGGLIYGAVYYFYFANKGGYNYESPTPSQTVTSTPQPSAAEVSQNEIEIKDFAFSPETLTVKVGDKVTWTNRDSVGHTATADDGSFDTSILSTGQSGSVTFDKAGTYAYHCTPHPKMKATIIVQ